MATAAPVNLNVLSPKQILELAETRRRDFSERDGRYEIYDRYYRGKSVAAGPSVLGSNSQGRPLLRVVGGSSQQERTYHSQALAPVIDDNQALVGRMPASRVEPPDQSPAGIAKGEKLTKYIASTHELSSMDRQQALAGYYLSGLGDVCYALEVEPELRRVVWSVVEPSTKWTSGSSP